MIYFINNYQLPFDWERAYHQLTSKYNQLANDYHKATEVHTVLLEKIETISKQNEEIKLKKRNKQFHLLCKDSVSLLPSFLPSQQEITIKANKKCQPKIVNLNSHITESHFDRHNYQCTYPGCHKVYGSSVSMNLHIKMKHNGGTKKERQAYAKMLIEAEQNGQEPPKSRIKLPPNFLQEFRTSYEYTKKYSM